MLFNPISQESLTLVSEENGMRFRGLVLDLHDIEADITVSDCSFSDTVVKFTASDPGIPSTSASQNNFMQMFHSISSFDKVQLTSLISVQALQGGSIVLSGNSFLRNGLVAALVRIDASDSQTSIVANVFEQAASAVGYSALEVRQCDNLELAENEFYETSGFSSAGVAQIQCLASNYFVYDSQLDSY